ncbi:hypothetical protein SAMN05660649_02253 [Desulfotomaculum arcticum]|uniref:Uncharacterized protein n=1 Tax=Desulfotruncus arcticus DSM 17038 TaxID=1121424 RepID=A0A1I2TGW6_9FIRM|nr:hypothetical protein SAMN05660649_02253 [Desulfotomaculum arcticum] [Desulfotruncus arcticus DSM 17038]
MTYSQGGVKVPTGGIPEYPGEPASALVVPGRRSADLVTSQSRR